jgi:hypothetical protein
MKNPNKYQRNCPKCSKVIDYGTIYAIRNAERDNRKCKSCALSEHSNKDEVKKQRSENMKGSKNPMFGKYADANPFYGKTHTESVKKKMKIHRESNSHIYKTDEFRKKISEALLGDKNPMYGKTFYEQWVLKYGVDVANEKLIEYKNKISQSTSGENNPMYGKPAPRGSGNGWSGWYKGWYFRSILELSYMINIIERFNILWKSAECNEYAIPYIWGGVKKTYFADFILDARYMVELKPISLQKTKQNIAKFEHAKEYCKDKSLIYKVTDIPKIKKEQLIDLVNNGLVILTKKWNERLKTT